MRAAKPKVEMVPLSDLREAPWNPRTMPEFQARALRSSLEEFGFVEPIVVNADGTILGGHQRYEAALELGMDAMPAVRVDLDERRAKLLNLALNKISGEWDEDLLDDVIRSVVDGESELLVAGFPEDEIARILADASANGDGALDAAPPVPAKPKTKLGDLYLLGPHRLVCGDASRPEVVARAVGDESVDIVWTDPPYGVDIQECDMQQAEVRGRRKDGKGVMNDDLTGDALAALLAAVFAETVKVTRPGAAWYVCAPPGVDYRYFLNVLADLGVARHGLVWVKDRFVMGRADYHYRHENIVYGWTPGAHQKVSGRTFDSVFEVPRPGASPEHPTMKPVELVAIGLRNSSKRGELVLDPFGGSGTTMIAAEEEGRRCAMVDLSPAYCDVAVQRWENLTGEKAERVR